MCRSRRELSNAYFLAKFGFDAAENEPCKVQRPLQRPSCTSRRYDIATSVDALVHAPEFLNNYLLNDFDYRKFVRAASATMAFCTSR